MTNKEAIEQIKKSHLIAMAMLTDGKQDEETEKAISIVEKYSEVLEILKEFEVDIAVIKNFDKYESYAYIQKRYRSKAMSYEQWLIIKEWLNDK